MGWAKFDDRWATHPKLLAAGLEAKGLDASAICWCAGQETDGFVPDVALPILASGHPKPRKVAEALVSVGRWVRDDERKGYVIHDYLDYNPTRADREAERTAKKEAGRLGGLRSSRSRTQAPASSTSEAEPQAPASDLPEADSKVSGQPPTRPDPSIDRSSSNHHRVGPPSEEEELLDQACREVARRRLSRRMADRELPLVNNPDAWASTAAERAREQADSLDLRGLDVEAIVDLLDLSPPEPPSPYPVWEPTEPDEPVTDAAQAQARLAELRRGA